MCPDSVGSTISEAQTTVGVDGRIKLCVVNIELNSPNAKLNIAIRYNEVTRYSSPSLSAGDANVCITYRPVQGEDSPSAVHSLEVIGLRGAKGLLFYDA
jgi:hypothetical protein